MKKRFRLFKLVLFSRIKKFFLGKHASGIFYTSENGLFIAPIEDMEVARQLGEAGGYNMDEIKVLNQFTQPEFTLYVIGSHIGTLLVPLAKLVKQIVAYEANPSTFQFLSANVKLNDLKNVELFNYAVGDKVGEIEFYQNRVNSGGSKIKPKTEKYYYTFDNPYKVVAQLMPLDLHLETNRLVPPDMMIMDIEGSEYFALLGMQKALKQCKVLYIEYVPHHLQNVAGVNNEAFLQLLTPHYQKMKIMEDVIAHTAQEYSQAEFLGVLNTLTQQERAVNLLFYN
ncbi:MAG: FkbM family methyltransferase [Microscillaceae bacterium]|jgi:FkbM family methyltransferase|nr:FkbM family methyltransferase [Microscillaceae bacterium]